MGQAAFPFLCYLLTFFLPWVETFLFLWICRCPFLVCRVAESATAIVRYESAVLRGWWTVTSRPASEDFALGLLNSSLFYSFEGWGNGPTCEGWDYSLTFIIWALPWVPCGPALLCLACGRWLNDFWASQQIAFPWDDPMFSGPLLIVLSWASLALHHYFPFFFGPMADGLNGPFYLPWLGKKLGIYTCI